MLKLAQYFKDSKAELKKVVWPTRSQTINHTILVVAISLAVAIFLGAADFALNTLLQLFVY